MTRPTGFTAVSADPVKQSGIASLIQAWRERGHLAADIDPLGIPRPAHPDLDPSAHGLTIWDLDRTFHEKSGAITLRKLLERGGLALDLPAGQLPVALFLRSQTLVPADHDALSAIAAAHGLALPAVGGQIGHQFGAAFEGGSVGGKRLLCRRDLAGQPGFWIFAGARDFAGPCAQAKAVYGEGSFQRHGTSRNRFCKPVRIKLNAR